MLKNIKQKIPWLIVTLCLLFIFISNLHINIGYYQGSGLDYNIYYIASYLLFPILGCICSGMYLFRNIKISKAEKVMWGIIAVAYFFVPVYIDYVFTHFAFRISSNIWSSVISFTTSLLFSVSVFIGIIKKQNKGTEKNKTTLFLTILTLLCYLLGEIMSIYILFVINWFT